MRLQDPAYTHVLPITPAEATPASQGASLRDELRRAKVEPWSWIIDKSLVATCTHAPLLVGRLAGEAERTAWVCDGLAKRVFFVPSQASASVGVTVLRNLPHPRLARGELGPAA